MRLLALLSTILVLTSCGYRGPLTLPPPSTQAGTPTDPPAASPRR